MIAVHEFKIDNDVGDETGRGGCWIKGILVINMRHALIRQFITLRFNAKNNPGEAPFQTKLRHLQQLLPLSC